MWLFGTQRFALRIERRRVGAEQCLEVGEPPLAVRGRRRDDRKEPLWQPAHERRDQDGRTRSRQPADASAMTGRWQLRRQRPRGRKLIKAVEEKIERH